MADNIVAGLFGLSPNQIQQQQQAQTYQRAQDFAGQSPFERANSLMYQGGAGAANVGAGMMGLVNPEVEAAKQRQAAMQGADVQTPEGLRALAARLQGMGMTQQAMIAAAKANEMEAGIQEGMVRSTEMAKNLALAEKAQRPEQQGGATPTVARLIEERGKYKPDSQEYKLLSDAIAKETYIKPEKPESESGMKPSDELRWMNQHSKDSQSAMSTIDTSTDAATKIIDIKNDPKFGYIFGGYTEQMLSKFSPGEIAGLQSNVDSLKSTLMVAGLNTMRAGGGVGAITEKEWPIFEKLVASLDQKMDEKTANKRLDEIYSYFDRAKSRASETYQKKWSKKAEFYDPEIVQRSKIPIVSQPRTSVPPTNTGKQSAPQLPSGFKPL